MQPKYTSVRIACRGGTLDMTDFNKGDGTFDVIDVTETQKCLQVMKMIIE